MISDRKLAKILKRTNNAVSSRRRQPGIRVYSPAGGWTPKKINLLGTAPDSKIARPLRICAGTVSKYRRQLGILDWLTRNYMTKVRET